MEISRSSTWPGLHVFQFAARPPGLLVIISKYNKPGVGGELKIMPPRSCAGWRNYLWTGNGKTGRMGHTSLFNQSAYFLLSCSKLIESPGSPYCITNFLHHMSIKILNMTLLSKIIKTSRQWTFRLVSDREMKMAASRQPQRSHLGSFAISYLNYLCSPFSLAPKSHYSLDIPG